MVRKKDFSGIEHPEEPKIGYFVYVLKNQVNPENLKHRCEHLNNLEICPGKASRFLDICFSRVSVWNESKGSVLTGIFHNP
jgi:hypothetical protein